MSPEQALQALKQGNQEYAEDHPHAPTINRERRQQISAGQSPFAVVVSCSDSRAPPELVFARGLGELFTVRVAGNSVDRTALGTIEYGVAELGCPLVVVMGHTQCGAVSAAIEAISASVGALYSRRARTVWPDPLSFTVSRDYFRGSLRTLSENRDEAFDLLGLALSKPRFDEVAVERVRGQELSEVRRELSNPPAQPASTEDP